MDARPARPRRRRDRPRRGAPRRAPDCAARLHPRRLPAHGRAGARRSTRLLAARHAARRRRRRRGAARGADRAARRAGSSCRRCGSDVPRARSTRRAAAGAAIAAAGSSTSATTIATTAIAVRLDQRRERDGAASRSYYRRRGPAAPGRRHRARATRSSRRISGEPPHDRPQVARGDRAHAAPRAAIVAEMLATLRERVRPGVTHGRARRARRGADAPARARARRSRATSCRAGRSRRSICISINDEVVHGIPSKRRVLRDGDIVGLDFGVCYRRATSATPRCTVAVGQVSPDGPAPDGRHGSGARGRHRGRSGPARTSPTSPARSRTSPRAPGSRWCASSSATASGGSCTRTRRCRTTAPGRAACGCRRASCWRSSRWSTPGRPRSTSKDDGWTAATRDGRLSAHFEHSVAVTADGPYILTPTGLQDGREHMKVRASVKAHLSEVQGHPPRAASCACCARTRATSSGRAREDANGTHRGRRSAAQQAHGDRAHLHLRHRPRRARSRSAPRREVDPGAQVRRSHRRRGERASVARSTPTYKVERRSPPRRRRGTSSGSSTSAATAACATGGTCRCAASAPTRTRARARGRGETVAGKKTAPPEGLSASDITSELKETDGEAAESRQRAKPRRAAPRRRKSASGRSSEGVLHIHSTFNNTIVTITRSPGQRARRGRAPGRCGFKGSRKGTPFAAQVAAEAAARKAAELGMRHVRCYVKGPGAGRESALREPAGRGLHREHHQGRDADPAQRLPAAEAPASLRT